MWTILSAAVPVALMLVGVLSIFGFVTIFKASSNRYPRRSPLTRKMLRPPGHSLRQKLLDSSHDIDTCFVLITLIPVSAYAVHVSQSYFGGVAESPIRTAIIVLAGLVFTAIVGRRLLRLMNERKKYVLGLDGELSTAEELNQLMLDGCRVFHDIPYLYGNIDHVVVSRSGVYSINTKLLGKPKDDGDSEIVVDYTRSIIRFPDREVPIPSSQPEREAKWVAEHLAKSVGESIKVEPMVALPGWCVKERIGRGTVCVFNPCKAHKFFVKDREVLTAKQIEQVAHQLEQLCRDVEPTFKREVVW
jgi:hypothetical protein